MDVTTFSNLYEISPLDRRRFYYGGGCALVCGIIGIVTKHPIVALPIPMSIIAIAMFRDMFRMLMVLFASFSVALYVYEVPADSIIFVFLSVTWFLHRKQYALQARKFRGIYLLAIGNAAWVGITLAVHFQDFLPTYSLIVGLRLISYYCMYVMVSDLLRELPRSQLLFMLRMLWGMSLVVIAVAFYQSIILGDIRVSSILEPHHSHLGNYGVAATLLAALVFIWARNSLEKFIAFGTILLGCMTIVLSETRSDILGITIGLTLFGALRGVRGFLAVGLTIVLLSQSGFVTSILEHQKDLTLQEGGGVREVASGVDAKYDPSSVDRVLVWIGVLNYAQETDAGHLLAGVGPGNFGDAMRPYLSLHAMYLNLPGVTINGAHNNILHIFSELGLIGLFLAASFFGAVMLSLFKIWRKQSGPVSQMAAVYIAGFVALIVSSFTQETFYAQPAMGNFYGLFLCLLAIMFRFADTSLAQLSDAA